MGQDIGEAFEGMTETFERKRELKAQRDHEAKMASKNFQMQAQLAQLARIWDWKHDQDMVIRSLKLAGVEKAQTQEELDAALAVLDEEETPLFDMSQVPDELQEFVSKPYAPAEAAGAIRTKAMTSRWSQLLGPGARQDVAKKEMLREVQTGVFKIKQAFDSFDEAHSQGYQSIMGVDPSDLEGEATLESIMAPVVTALDDVRGSGEYVEGKSIETLLDKMGVAENSPQRQAFLNYARLSPTHDLNNKFRPMEAATNDAARDMRAALKNWYKMNQEEFHDRGFGESIGGAIKEDFGFGKDPKSTLTPATQFYKEAMVRLGYVINNTSQAASEYAHAKGASRAVRQLSEELGGGKLTPELAKIKLDQFRQEEAPTVDPDYDVFFLDTIPDPSKYNPDIYDQIVRVLEEAGLPPTGPDPHLQSFGVGTSPMEEGMLPRNPPTVAPGQFDPQALEALIQEKAPPPQNELFIDDKMGPRRSRFGKDY